MVTSQPEGTLNTSDVVGILECSIDGEKFPSYDAGRLHMIEDHYWPFPDSNAEYAVWLVDQVNAHAGRE